MKLVSVLISLCLLAQSMAFVPNYNKPVIPRESLSFLQLAAEDAETTLVDVVAREKRGFIGSRVASVVAGWVSGLCGYVTRGMAEDLEYAELPPPYVPAIFGVVLLAGVGLLTASLGDVMDEGKTHQPLSESNCTLLH